MIAPYYNSLIYFYSICTPSSPWQQQCIRPVVVFFPRSSILHQQSTDRLISSESSILPFNILYSDCKELADPLRNLKQLHNTLAALSSVVFSSVLLALLDKRLMRFIKNSWLFQCWSFPPVTIFVFVPVNPVNIYWCCIFPLVWYQVGVDSFHLSLIWLSIVF